MSNTFDIYYDAFDKLGYSKLLAEKRVLLYDKIMQQFMLRGILWHRGSGNINLIIAGSRGEGCGIFSDVDVLFIHRYVKCFEDVPTPLRKRPSQAVFQLDFEGVPKGYTMLKLVRIDDFDFRVRSVDEYLTNIMAALVENNGSHYLRNDQLLIHDIFSFLMESVTQKSVFAGRNGPAMSFVIDAKYLNVSLDFVQAFPCSCPSVVYDWCNRDRKYDWPTKDSIETVKGLDVLVVPVGKKDSTEEALQWRISHTLSEQALVRSFNDPQIKVYVALKMLVKHELKSVCENITSYIVKNTIFWAFERSRPVCTKTDFLEVLLYSLRYLKVSIVWQYLPSYIMPSRNLLENKVSEREKFILIQRLNGMIEEGRDVLLRCPLVKGMSEMPSNGFQDRLIYREISDQLLLSLVAFPSTDMKLYMRFLYEFNYRNKEHFIPEWIVAIFPYIRRSNPLGFFNRIISMIDDEIIYRLFEGLRLGYSKE